MAVDRIRLSERARKRLIALADEADLQPSFLLEYLIIRHGKDATQLLSGQQSALVTQTSTNEPYPVTSVPVSTAQNDSGTTPSNSSFPNGWSPMLKQPKASIYTVFDVTQPKQKPALTAQSRPLALHSH
jgi:hypothetical protein